ncbi:M48 family metallopeptidase [Methylomagnum sp.]
MNPPSWSANKRRLGWKTGGGWGLRWACIGWLMAGQPVAQALCPGEQERAANLRQRILQEWPLRSTGDEATQFVQTLGVRLSAGYSQQGGAVPWRFALVRNLAPNAFSIGSGYVFVTEGAVRFAEDEEELAAILAHEQGHQWAGHFCDRPTPRESGGFFEIFFGDPPAPDQHETVGVGSVRQSVDSAKELEADRIAVAILRAGGYDPHALLRVARRLGSGREGHLFDPARVQSLERLLAKFPPAAAPRDSERFREIKNALVDEVPGP